MTVTYADAWLTIHQGDCREVLATLEPESVHCVVTSPPYWGLRDYGTATWQGGDAEHKHVAVGAARTPWANAVPGPAGANGKNAQQRNETKETGGSCACGARRIDSQLGLEPTPDEYVANLVAVFREVRRVLRKDGTVWLVLGDSYSADHAQKRNAGWKGEGASGNSGLHSGIGGSRARDGRGTVPGLKPKDRVMIPARVALALQADGWWLRDEIVWSKPNPMPSSVTDRTTPAHEMIYLLSKSARYWYDAAAIREPMAGSSIQRINQPSFDAQTGGPKDYANGTNPNASARKALENVAKRHRRTPAGWNVNHDESNLLGRYAQRADKQAAAPPPGSASSRTMAGLNARWDESEANGTAPAGRNKRSVWTVATEAYPAAHFATFPTKLIEPMILAGTSARGVCPECGAPWVRVVDKGPPPPEPVHRHPEKRLEAGQAGNVGAGNMGFRASRLSGQEMAAWRAANPDMTAGWRPTCAHEADPIPATILDCFAGSGTVGLVAQRLGRKTVLIELSPDYIAQAIERIAAGRADGSGPALDMPVPFRDDGLWVLPAPDGAP